MFEAKFFNELKTTELYEILKVRSEIFVVEQNCIYQDLDDKDYKSLHVFRKDGEKVIATIKESKIHFDSYLITFDENQNELSTKQDHLRHSDGRLYKR